MELATMSPYYNSAPVPKGGLHRLLRNAYAGKPPESYLL
jgi:hypothetical protein